MEALKNNEEINQAFIKPDNFMILIKRINNPKCNIPLIIQSFYLFTSSINDDKTDYRKMLIDNKVYETLLSLCFDRWMELVVLNYCIELFSWLCKDNKYRKYLIEEGIIDEILSIVDEHSYIKNTVIKCGDLLKDFENDEEICKLMLSKGYRDKYFESFNSELHKRGRTILLSMWVDIISPLNSYGII